MGPGVIHRVDSALGCCLVQQRPYGGHEAAELVYDIHKDQPESGRLRTVLGGSEMYASGRVSSKVVNDPPSDDWDGVFEMQTK